jgi:hypothetical protein
MLFTNEPSFTIETEFDDLVEATFDGYERISLTRTGWTDPVQIAALWVRSTWGPMPAMWTCTGNPQVIYGYGVVDGYDDTLMWGNRLGMGYDVGLHPTIAMIPTIEALSMNRPPF